MKVLINSTITFPDCQVCGERIKWYQRRREIATSGHIGATFADKAWYRHRKCDSNSIYCEDTLDVVMRSTILRKVWSLKEELDPTIYSRLCEEISSIEVFVDKRNAFGLGIGRQVIEKANVIFYRERMKGIPRPRDDPRMSGTTWRKLVDHLTSLRKKIKHRRPRPTTVRNLSGVPTY